MRKRLRKKRHLGEFQEFGVELSIMLCSDTDFEEFLDNWIANAVEANGLVFGGGGKAHECSGYLELGPRDIFRANLAKIESWLTSYGNIKSFRIDEPVDAWYPVPSQNTTVELGIVP